MERSAKVGQRGADYVSDTQRDGGTVIGLSAAAYLDARQRSRGWVVSGAGAQEHRIREAKAEE